MTELLSNDNTGLSSLPSLTRSGAPLMKTGAAKAPTMVFAGSNIGPNIFQLKVTSGAVIAAVAACAAIWGAIVLIETLRTPHAPTEQPALAQTGDFRAECEAGAGKGRVVSVSLSAPSEITLNGFAYSLRSNGDATYRMFTQQGAERGILFIDDGAWIVERTTQNWRCVRFRLSEI